MLFPLLAPSNPFTRTHLQSLSLYTTSAWRLSLTLAYLFLLEHGTYYALLKLRVGMSALPLSEPWHSGSFGLGTSVVGLFHAREDAEQRAWPLPARCRALSPPHPAPTVRTTKRVP